MAAAKLHSSCSQCAKLGFSLGVSSEDRRRRIFCKSIQLLQNSAKSGCHLCMLIFTSIAPQNGAGGYWRRELDVPIEYAYIDNGEPHLLISWGLTNRRLKLSPLPSPRVLRQPSISAPPQASSLLRHVTSESKEQTY